MIFFFDDTFGACTFTHLHYFPGFWNLQDHRSQKKSWTAEKKKKKNIIKIWEIDIGPQNFDFGP